MLLLGGLLMLSVAGALAAAALLEDGKRCEDVSASPLTMADEGFTEGTTTSTPGGEAASMAVALPPPAALPNEDVAPLTPRLALP